MANLAVLQREVAPCTTHRSRVASARERSLEDIGDARTRVTQTHSSREVGFLDLFGIAARGNCRAASGRLNRQQSNPVPVQVNCHHRSFLELGPAGPQGTQENVAYGCREDVLSSDLDNARLAGLPVGQKRTEVKIMGEYGHAVSAGIVHNLRAGCGRVAHRRPMNALETGIGQERDPLRAQVHVDEESHAACSGTSISSTRQAEATSPTTMPTVTRRPRTQGLPPITSGFLVTRSSRISCTIAFYRPPGRHGVGR
jgi:hypothetical protein